MKTKKTSYLMFLLLFMSDINTCLAQDLWRAGGKAWLENEYNPGHYWEIDTTQVIVEVKPSEMPKDIGWELDDDGTTPVPVPEGVTIETFADSLRAFSWVISIGYCRAGNMIGEKYLQTLLKGKEWVLIRLCGKAWIEDYVDEGYYWEVDTTTVIVHVYDPSEVPEDITWKINKLNFAAAPVPGDMKIEDFMAALRKLSWVKLVEYNSYGVPASWDEIVSIKGVAVPQGNTTPKSSQSGLYDLTGRPIRTAPACGIYIRDGKKVMAK